MKSKWVLSACLRVGERVWRDSGLDSGVLGRAEVCFVGVRKAVGWGREWRHGGVLCVPLSFLFPRITVS